MTGPEHYAEAERLIEHAGEAATAEMTFARLATGQVHATLALAAATAVAPGLWTTAWDEAIT